MLLGFIGRVSASNIQLMARLPVLFIETIVKVGLEEGI
jgi:hypothetical protein